MLIDFKKKNLSIPFAWITVIEISLNKNRYIVCNTDILIFTRMIKKYFKIYWEINKMFNIFLHKCTISMQMIIFIKYLHKYSVFKEIMNYFKEKLSQRLIYK